MSVKQKHLPVWFFVGVLMFVFGIVVFFSGIYWFFTPSGVILANLHTGIWWGVVMTSFGLLFSIKHGPWKKKGVE